jgi:hypothetical protein
VHTLALGCFCISNKQDAAFLVFLGRYLARGISLLQQLERCLQLAVRRPVPSSHRHKEGKEHDPEEKPENPPIRVHPRPIVAIHRDLSVPVRFDI